MTQIISLLIMALNLLTAVQANPNLPPSFKQNAVEIATYAIKVSQEALKQSTIPAPVSVPTPIPAPIVEEKPTSIPLKEPEKQIPVSVSIKISDPTDFDIQRNRQYGVYIFMVSFLDKDGNTVPNLPVTFQAPDNYLEFYYKQFRDTPNPAFGYTTSIIGDSKIQFTYIPMSVGQKEFNIYSGNVSKKIIFHKAGELYNGLFTGERDVISLKPVQLDCSDYQAWNNTISCFAVN